MPILSLSSASLLENNNLRRTMKDFDAAEKIHVGADANQKINFHRPFFASFFERIVTVFSKKQITRKIMTLIRNHNLVDIYTK